MSTLGYLTDERPNVGLKFADAAHRAAHHNRAVSGTHRVAVIPVADALDLADCLVIVEAAAVSAASTVQADRLVRDLAQRQAAGLALAVDAGAGDAIPPTIRQAAHRVGVPLLVTQGDPAAWAGIDRVLAGIWHRRAQQQLNRVTAYFEHLPGELRQADFKQVLVEGLAESLDRYVGLMSPADRNVCVESPEDAPAQQRSVAQHLAFSTDTARDPQVRQGVHVVKLPVSSMETAPYLVAAGASPFAPETLPLAEVTVKLLAMAHDAQRARELRESARGVRLGAFQMLMGGQTLLAQRALAALEPGLLQTSRIRVYVIAGPPEQREDAVSLLEAHIGGKALLVRCPARGDHVIIVDPLHGGEDAPGSVAQTLRRTMAVLPGRSMGGSRPYPLGAVAEAYGEAANALLSARYHRDRIDLFDGSSQLAPLLGDAAHVWAERVLAPLLGLPLVVREELTSTLRITMEFSHARTARILGAHRNTVSARVARCAEVLGQDGAPLHLKDARLRTVLHLVLSLVYAPVPPAQDAPGSPSLAAILQCAPAQAWARGLLQPLHDDERDLLSTLRAWVGCNLHVEEAAAQLGIGARAVRLRLRCMESLLQRDLSSGLAGAHAAILALAITSGDPVLPELG
ncbi:helix-turn-helix domain-containing protein [Streptomyces sp. NPDC059994]|uniref:helix-turn-helix domain-containing protein n=1 Tax=Streptomyces sp. NPDC059994 TaxID=3347029 RepID=UPI0036B49B4B